MRPKLLFASVLTLGILAGFVFFVFYLIAFWANILDFTMLVVFTIITNFVLWLASPAITDWVQGFFYKVRWVTFDEFSKEHTGVATFLKQVCEKHNINIPRLRIIEDANPTAYCYGSYPNNARIVVSEGIFKYLDAEVAEK